MQDVIRKKFIDTLVSEVEKRVLSRLGTNAYLNRRIGIVASASIAAMANGSVYIANDTTYASPNFKNLTGNTVTAGQTVMVVIDPTMGDRYIDKRVA
jgi:hypothetical protein